MICKTCKHETEPWYSDACDGCCENHSNYESVNKLKYTFEDRFELISNSIGSKELAALADVHGFVEVSEVEE